MSKIKVVVVDDSALVRSLLTEIINRQPDMTCVGAAADPLVAREMIRETNPDVITLDVEMPRMDGLEFLSRLMRLRPMPVVMVSTLSELGADITLRALEMGAVDYVAKPRIGITSGLNELAGDIVDKIRIAAAAHVRRMGAAPAASVALPGLGEELAGVRARRIEGERATGGGLSARAVGGRAPPGAPRSGRGQLVRQAARGDRPPHEHPCPVKAELSGRRQRACGALRRCGMSPRRR